MFDWLLIECCCWLIIWKVKDSLEFKPYIVNGSMAKQDQYPFMVALLYNNEHICGGSVIRDNLVLTAAHCFLGDPYNVSQYSVYLGQVKLSRKRGALYKNHQIPVKKLVPHKKFTKNWKDFYFSWDIALVVLASRIDFRHKHKHVAPIALPEDSLQKFKETNCTTLGWGKDEDDSYPSDLAALTIPKLDHTICERDGVKYRPKQQLCISVKGGAQAVCHGDSGGPLFCAALHPTNPEVENRFLVGVTSFGFMLDTSRPPTANECSENGIPTYYTRTNFFLKWINFQIWLFRT